MKKVLSVMIALAVSGCATSSKDIASSYQSPLIYQSHDCNQIIAENVRIQAKMRQIGGRLDEAASNDKMLVAGSLLLWPTLFFVGGTKQQESEYAAVKGQYDALQQAAIEKKCGLPPVTAEPAKA